MTTEHNQSGSNGLEKQKQEVEEKIHALEKQEHEIAEEIHDLKEKERELEREAHLEIHIQIDRVQYLVHKREMTGAELRNIPQPPVGPDRDLFEVVAGAPDKKIGDTDVVELHNGKRFFTAPGQINPGCLQKETAWESDYEFASIGQAVSG